RHRRGAAARRGATDAPRRAARPRHRRAAAASTGAAARRSRAARRRRAAAARGAGRRVTSATERREEAGGDEEKSKALSRHGCLWLWGPGFAEIAKLNHGTWAGRPRLSSHARTSASPVGLVAASSVSWWPAPSMILAVTSPPFAFATGAKSRAPE